MNNQRMTSLVTFAVSVAFWYLLTNSLPMAVGILLLVFIHEMGHYYAARLKGLNVALPVFTPLGAMVQFSHPGSARNEAFVALAGPVVGGIASLIVMALGPILGSSLLFSLGMWGVVINLMNLIPLEPLDGGKISLVIERRLYFLGVPLFLYFMMQFGMNMFNMIMAFLILRQSWVMIQERNRQALSEPEYFELPWSARTLYILGYGAIAALLAWVTLAPQGFIKLLVMLGL